MRRFSRNCGPATMSCPSDSARSIWIPRRRRTPLRATAPRLCQALDRIRDAAEWGVKLYCDRTCCVAGSKPNPIPSGSCTTCSGTPRRGLGSFCRRSMPRRSMARPSRRSQARCGEFAEASIAAPANPRRSKCSRLRCMAGPTEMVMNAAYLVAAGSLAQFRQTIAALQGEFAAHGFDHELTGPWPPYHFVSVRQEGIADAATSDQ